jgi:hypothetical protein
MNPSEPQPDQDNLSTGSDRSTGSNRSSYASVLSRGINQTPPATITTKHDSPTDTSDDISDLIRSFKKSNKTYRQKTNDRLSNMENDLQDHFMLIILFKRMIGSETDEETGEHTRTY